VLAEQEKAAAAPRTGGRPGLGETSDFYPACFLRCSGYELAGRRCHGRRCVFTYRDRPTRPRDVLAFHGGRAAVVPPLRLAGASKDMKAMLHNVPARVAGPGRAGWRFAMADAATPSRTGTIVLRSVPDGSGAGRADPPR
jgi:hypothetical protein